MIEMHISLMIWIQRNVRILCLSTGIGFKVEFIHEKLTIGANANVGEIQGWFWNVVKVGSSNIQMDLRTGMQGFRKLNQMGR